MEVLALVIVVALVLFFVLGGARAKQVEHAEVGARNGLAFALTAEMRTWEAGSVGGPRDREVGPIQCLDRGSRWVLERARIAPKLAEMIAKEAYLPILADKIERRLGPAEFNQWRANAEAKERELDRQHSQRAGVDKWWDDVDYRYDILYEKASECGALDRSFAEQFYNRADPAATRPLDAASKIRKCKKCDTANPIDAAFCKRCGIRIGSVECAACGSSNDHDASFCNRCGKALSDPNAFVAEAFTAPKDATAVAPEPAVRAAIIRLRRCPSCGQENKGEAYQCSQCRHVFSKETASSPMCRNCGKTSASGATRCRWCLTPLKRF